MTKFLIVLSLVLFSCGFILESHQTHVSKPVLSLDKTQYKSGEKVVLSGWVNYNDEPTSEVLLRILVTDPSEATIFEEFTTSKEDGTFFSEFSIPTNSQSGMYEIDVSSFCREIHRDICTHKNELLTISVEGYPTNIENEKSEIPPHDPYTDDERLQIASEKKFVSEETMGGGSGMGLFGASDFGQNTILVAILIGAGSAIGLIFYFKKRQIKND